MKGEKVAWVKAKKAKYFGGNTHGDKVEILKVDDDLKVAWTLNPQRPRQLQIANTAHHSEEHLVQQTSGFESPGPGDLASPSNRLALLERSLPTGPSIPIQERTSASHVASKVELQRSTETALARSGAQSRRPVHIKDYSTPKSCGGGQEMPIDRPLPLAGSPMEVDRDRGDDVDSDFGQNSEHEVFVHRDELIFNIGHRVSRFLDRNPDVKWMLLDDLELPFHDHQASDQQQTERETADRIVKHVINPVLSASTSRLGQLREGHRLMIEETENKLNDAKNDLESRETELNQTVQELRAQLSEEQTKLSEKTEHYSKLLQQSHTDDAFIISLQAQVKTGKTDCEALRAELVVSQSELAVALGQLQQANDGRETREREVKSLQVDRQKAEERHRKSEERTKEEHQKDREKLVFQHQQQMEQLKDGYQKSEERRKENARRAKEDSDRKLRDSVSQHKQQITKLKDDHRLKIVGREDEYRRYKEQVNSTIESKNAQIENLQSTYAADKQLLESKHANALLSLENKQKEELKRINKEHDDEEEKARQDHNGVVKDLNQHHAREKAEMLQKTEAMEKYLTAKSKSDTLRLRKQIVELNTALENLDGEVYHGKVFSTAGLPRKADDELRRVFVSVRTIVVEELGRLEWKSERRILSDELLRQRGGPQNQRLLKKAILQDLVWNSLYEYVFASPFRVVGDEGRALEQQWVEQCGEGLSSDEGYSWPDPGTKAERWRYFTMEQCYEALKTRVSNRDPRARVKKGYKDNIASLTRQIESTLEELIDMNQEVSAIVQKLCLEAAKIWIDFEMHRCRIVLRLAGPGSVSPLDRVSQISKGSVDLTVAPTLGRSGNMKGLELDTFTVIGGCEGESFSLQ